jgi:hypothetical protein
MQMDKSFFPIFSPFLSFLFFPFFFPFILLLCFCVFLFFSPFFQVLKKVRISYGLADIMLNIKHTPRNHRLVQYWLY